MQKIIFTILLTSFCILHMNAQFGYGFTVTNDIYQRHTNPKDNSGQYRGSGSAVLNFAAGPKIWIGSQDVSISLEAQAGIGLLSLAVVDFKGLGAAYFPIMAKLNFKGLSGLDKEGRQGWYIGGGIQYSRTELYGLSNKAERAGVDRSLFPSYIGQFGYGFGLSGFVGSGFIRAGYNPDTSANFFAIGIQADFNKPMLKKIANAASQL
jgi:hypothetical protein